MILGTLTQTAFCANRSALKHRLANYMVCRGETVKINDETADFIARPVRRR